MLHIPRVTLRGPNVVQAEFFRVSMSGLLNTMLVECHEQRADGLPIKTCVRFYDEHGFVTDFMLRAAALWREHEEVREAYAVVGPIRRWFLDRKSKKLAVEMDELRTEALAIAAERVDKVINTGGTIAVECPDYSYRKVQGEELYELCMATGRAKGVRLFLFQNNDLLADTNSPVCHFV